MARPADSAWPAARIFTASALSSKALTPAVLDFLESTQAPARLFSPSLVKTRDNEFVYLPRAFAQQPLFQAAVARAAQRLVPDVVDVIPTLGDDWRGEPAVFFMVILADAASRRDRLLRVTNHVSTFIVQEVRPLEQWGVLPYFNFRSQSEHASINQHALAS
ncbi:MAG TPA: hypothetical protein VN924_32960 [Bryobacteraceae bacterium]|nr:hypothetical protein [Bryobacteraceae bacterium]